MDANMIEAARQVVSLHAVSRYCEKFLTVRMSVLPDAGPEEIAEAYCAAAGTTIDDVRAKLLTPVVQCGLNMHVPYFASGGVGFNVSRAGVIVSIGVPHRRNNIKMKILSNREARHKQKRFDRRLHPAPIQGELQ